MTPPPQIWNAFLESALEGNLTLTHSQALLDVGIHHPINVYSQAFITFVMILFWATLIIFLLQGRIMIYDSPIMVQF